LLMASSPWVKPYYPDGGYPSVGAGRQAVLREEILVPLKSGPEFAMLLPPWVLEEGKTPVQTVFRFQVAGKSEGGTTLRPTEVKQYPLDGAVTTQLAGDATQPLWLRLHAMNWLAESNFDGSVGMLLRVESDDGAPRAMRNAALLNLGLHQYKPAIPAMLARLNNKTDPVERMVAIDALGETGDPSVAAPLRPLLNDSNGMVALAAIEAVGKLKDAESVAVMLGMLAKGTQCHAIARSLVEIGSPGALSGLLKIVRDRKSEFHARRFSGLALGRAHYGPAVPILAKVLGDETDDAGIRLNMISALEASGGPDAWKAIRSACDPRDMSVATAALEAMARSKDAGNKAYVIDIAGRPGHPLRWNAIHGIEFQKITGAGPTLKAAIHDPATSAVLLTAAMSALVAIGEKVESEDLAPLWSAYRNEKDSAVGRPLADALIAGKFHDKTAIPYLVAGLNKDKNTLWFANVKLLRHLTGQKLGPADEYSGDEKSLKADLDKWREWWAQQPK